MNFKNDFSLKEKSFSISSILEYFNANISHTQNVDRERVILHSDLNNFYASVETVRHPELKGKAIVVCGSKDDRHGIVLAKNQIAKSFGIKTGDVYWEAKRKCPSVVELTADFSEYLKYSGLVRKIYERYTDRIESFGIDECWLDVTSSVKLFGSGEEIAEQIRAAVKNELNLTVSIGVSWNKIFAKLGSDMKKPDAITVINKENFKRKVYPLPVQDLLYVGNSTRQKLNKYNINTIGDLANADVDFLKSKLGKWGEYLSIFARGEECSPVLIKKNEDFVKSIGNSMTCYRDLTTPDEVFTLILLLSESVASRLRSSGVGRANSVHVTVTDCNLVRYGKQGRLPFATELSTDIAYKARDLLNEIYDYKTPVRAVGVAVSDFTGEVVQTSIFIDEKKAIKAQKSVDTIRKKYGSGIINRGTILKDERLKNAKLNGGSLRPDDNS